MGRSNLNLNQILSSLLFFFILPASLAQASTAPAFIWSNARSYGLESHGSVDYQMFSLEGLMEHLLHDFGWSELRCSNNEEGQVEAVVAFVGEQESNDPIKAQSVDVTTQESNDPIKAQSVDITTQESNDPIKAQSVDITTQESDDPIKAQSVDVTAQGSSDPIKVQSVGVSTQVNETLDDVIKAVMALKKFLFRDNDNKKCYLPCVDNKTSTQGTSDPIKVQSVDVTTQGSIDPIRAQSVVVTTTQVNETLVGIIKTVRALKEFLFSGDDHIEDDSCVDDQQDPSTSHYNEGREDLTFDIFLNFLSEHQDLRELYAYHQKNSEGFDCLVCVSSGQKVQERFSNLASLIRHAKTTSKKRTRSEHMGYARAICNILDIDPDKSSFSLGEEGALSPLRGSTSLHDDHATSEAPISQDGSIAASSAAADQHE